jgi:hypothetical protein
MADIIEQAVDNANEKRKSRKDAGEEVGDLTADEVIQEAAEMPLARASSSLSERMFSRQRNR